MQYNIVILELNTVHFYGNWTNMIQTRDAGLKYLYDDWTKRYTLAGEQRRTDTWTHAVSKAYSRHG